MGRNLLMRRAMCRWMASWTAGSSGVVDSARWTSSFSKVIVSAGSVVV